MKTAACLWKSRAPTATILIRFLVGAVFLSEGIQKFLFASTLGAGRFARIGLPVPDFLAPLVACFEISCGLLVILGWGTRLAAVPLFVIISTAIASTKIPILLHSGFWKMAHEARTDFCMLLGSLFLILVGAGRWSVDAALVSSSTPLANEPAPVAPAPPAEPETPPMPPAPDSAPGSAETGRAERK